MMNSEKEHGRIKRAAWCGLKTYITAVVWFFSSLLVAPIYLGLTQRLLRIPETGILNRLWFLGGAVVWFIVLYFLVSLILWWEMRKFKDKY